MPEVHAHLIRGIRVRSWYSSNLIGWHPNFAGNRPPGNCARVNCCQWWACFCLCRFFHESPMPLVSSCKPSATGAPSVVVSSIIDITHYGSMQMLFGRHVGCMVPRQHTTWEHWSFEGLASGSDVAVTVELETRSPSGWRWVKWEDGVKEREGEERRKAGRSSLIRARLSIVCPARLMEDEGRCQLSCKLRELYTHTMVARLSARRRHTLQTDTYFLQQQR